MNIEDIENGMIIHIKPNDSFEFLLNGDSITNQKHTKNTT